MKYCLPWLLLVSFSTHAAEVYVSRDAAGNAVFSDKAHANSQRHEVRELPSVPAVTARATPPQPASSTGAIFTYTSLGIISPTNGQTIPPGYASNIEVSGVLSPGLREADTIILMINGTVAREGRQTTFTLSDIPRGEQQLQLIVRDKDGKTLISSNPVTIYVHRPSVLNRAPK